MQKTYCFRSGRVGKNGRTNPGILAVDNKYQFVAHEGTKDGNIWSYYCKHRLTPKVRCQAKARVVRFEDKWIEPNRPKVTAELLRERMKNLVRNDPAKAVGKAVRAVQIEAAREFGDDEMFYQHLVAELGTDSALEKQLLRVREEIIGKTPRSRNAFDPAKFIQGMFGDTNDVVLDSNDYDLKDGWRDDIYRENINSEFDWNNLTEDILTMEESESPESNIEMETEPTENNQGMEDELVDRDLPKRVLAFTSHKLLKQLGKNYKTSVDGTFKSSCSLWSQQFIWMVKAKSGY